MDADGLLLLLDAIARLATEAESSLNPLTGRVCAAAPQRSDRSSAVSAARSWSEHQGMSIVFNACGRDQSRSLRATLSCLIFSPRSSKSSCVSTKKKTASWSWCAEPSRSNCSRATARPIDAIFAKALHMGPPDLAAPPTGLRFQLPAQFLTRPATRMARYYLQQLRFGVRHKSRIPVGGLKTRIPSGAPSEAGKGFPQATGATHRSTKVM